MRIAVVAALIGGLMALGDAVWAQDAEPIVVANEIVARVRDKGDCANVFQRAAKVQQAITDCISKREAGTPKMALKKENGRWSIYATTTRLIQVWPEDAKSQGVDELTLARRWLTNFQRALPKAEPFRFRVERMGNAAYDRPIPPKPAPPVATPNPAPAANPVGSQASAPSDEPKILTQPSQRSTALLVVLDIFNIMRTYSDQEYEAKKDVLGERLIERLRPFILGTVKIEEPVAPTPGAPLTSPAPGGAEPRLAPGVPAGPPPIPETPPTTPSHTAPTKTAGPPPAAPRPVASLKPAAPASVSGAYAKVPQKERIVRKMNALRGPLGEMKQQGDPQADRVEKLLAAGRNQFYNNQFDAAEEAVDAALRMLGLEVQ